MNHFWRDSFKKAVPGFLAFAMTVAFFFCIYKFNVFGDMLKALERILVTFIYGGVMAYLLKTPYNFIERKLTANLLKNKRGLAKAVSVIAVLLAAFAVIALLLVLIIPALAESIASIIQQIPKSMEEIQPLLDSISNIVGGDVVDNYTKKLVNIVDDGGVTWLKNNILPRLQEIMGQFASTVGSIVGVLYNLLMGIIICIYILLDKDKFARQGKMLIHSIFSKKVADAIVDEFVFIDKTFNGFFAGKIVDSAIVGLICYAFCLIMQFTVGFKNAVLISVIVGVTNIIPYFGPYIGAIPSALLVLMDSPRNCIIFVIFIILLQQFDGNVLGTILLSESVGLSGFWVLFSITLFGGLWGFVGIILGVPVFAVIYDLIKRLVYFGLRKHGAEEMIPKPKEPKEKPKKKEKKPFWKNKTDNGKKEKALEEKKK